MYEIFAISPVSLVGSTCGLNDVNQKACPRLPPASDLELEDDIVDVEDLVDDLLKFYELIKSSFSRRSMSMT